MYFDYIDYNYISINNFIKILVNIDLIFRVDETVALLNIINISDILLNILTLYIWKPYIIILLLLFHLKNDIKRNI